MESMLEKGVTSQGAVTRTHDKDGLRVHKATPVHDNSNKTASLPSNNGRASKGVSSDTKRSNVGL